MTVADCVEWIARPGAELALTGTAAVVAPVGTLVVDGVALPVGTPGADPRTDELRAALVDIQTGRAPGRLDLTRLGAPRAPKSPKNRGADGYWAGSGSGITGSGRSGFGGTIGSGCVGAG